MPLYLLICFGFHFWIGVTATFGALVLVVLTGLTEILTRQPIREAAHAGTLRIMLAESGQRNAEALQAMGMAGWLGREWGQSDDDLFGRAAARERRQRRPRRTGEDRCA